MQEDAAALANFTTVAGRAAHYLLTARNSPTPVIGSSPVSVMIPDSRGGTSQGLDIRIAPTGTIGGVDYGSGTLSARAGYTGNTYPADYVYKFTATVRVTAGTNANRDMPPYDVWIRPNPGAGGGNISYTTPQGRNLTNLARNQTGQNGVDIPLEFELTGLEITQLIAAGATVLRIGGAGQNNFQIRSLVITERAGGQIEPPDPCDCDFHIVKTGSDNWLEIQNLTDKSVSMKGMYLSNNAGDLLMWSLSSYIILPEQSLRINGVGNNSGTFRKRARVDFNIGSSSVLLLAEVVDDEEGIGKIVPMCE